jgi:predicted DNA-binding protein YlxM (UPF0122 family)
MNVLQNAPKSSNKRRLESLDEVDNTHHLKRQCLDLKDDVEWVKVDISDTDVCMREIAEHFRGDVEEVIDHIRQCQLFLILYILANIVFVIDVAMSHNFLIIKKNMAQLCIEEISSKIKLI